ncbi:MAG: M1 family metallopeptidase [Spirochaetales bacterium]|nr:M1 family metallopeptidase [Spirochaetales bacterium]
MYVIIPNHYDLFLSPDFNDFNCTGSVRIDAQAVEAISEITMNAVDIKFNKTLIRDSEGEIDVDISFIPEKQEVLLHLPRSVKGSISIVIDFTSIIAEEFHGLYRCSYKSDGMKKIMITSQFEEEDARRAFPCFDTPALKATFSLEMVVPQSMTPVFCTEADHEEPSGNGKKLVRFRKTPVMATYVLYFGIGDFKMISKSDGNLTARLFSLFDDLDQGSWTLDAMIDAVRYMENKTGVAYPISKIDYISVPGFPFLAMENYGAITAVDYRVNIDNNKTPPGEYAFNYMILYHEVTHMWLGNLVTPRNWNDVWLNESFTEFVGEKMINDINPDWEVNYFDTDYLGRRARILDGGEFVGAIHEPDFDRGFNAADVPIVYMKGTFVLNMFYQQWGEESFFNGISHIMESVPFQSISNKEYTQLFSEGSGHDFKTDVMPWILQHGIPELQVERIGNKVRLSQRRFRYGNTVPGDVWPIPLEIRFRGADKGETTQLLIMRKESITLPVPAGTKAIQCNNGYTGYFRTAFDDNLLAGFLSLCREKKITAEDRSKFIDDLFAFARRGDYSLDQVLDYLEKFFPEEKSLVVILELQRNLLDLIRISPRHTSRAKQFISGIVNKMIKQAGKSPWKGQSFGETMYWEEILRYSLAFECTQALELSLDAYQGFLATGKCHPAVYSSALCAAAYTNQIDIEDIIVKIEDETTSAAERFLYLKTLASFRDQPAINRCMKYGLKELRTDLSKVLMTAIFITPWSWEAVCNHFVNKPEMMDRFPAFTRGIIALNIIPLTAHKELDKTISFLNNLAKESNTMAHIVRISIESIEHDMVMRKRNE